MATSTLRNQAGLAIPQAEGYWQKVKDMTKSVKELAYVYFGAPGSITHLEDGYRAGQTIKERVETDSGLMGIGR